MDDLPARSGDAWSTHLAPSLFIPFQDRGITTTNLLIPKLLMTFLHDPIQWPKTIPAEDQTSVVSQQYEFEEICHKPRVHGGGTYILRFHIGLHVIYHTFTRWKFESISTNFPFCHMEPSINYVTRISWFFYPSPVLVTDDRIPETPLLVWRHIFWNFTPRNY